MLRTTTHLGFDTKDYYMTLLARDSELGLDMYPADENESNTENYTLLLRAEELVKLTLGKGMSWEGK